MRKFMALSAAACATMAHSVAFFGEDLGPPNGNTRGPRVNADAAHAAFLATFATTGFESFETRPNGNLATTSPLQFVGTPVLGTITPFTAPAPQIDQINSPVATNAGAYPTHGVKYLSMGLGASSGDTSSSMNIFFSQGVSGFGLYMTDIEYFRPQVRIYSTTGVTVVNLPNTVWPAGGSPRSATIAFWGWRDTGLIGHVELSNFGSGPGRNPSDRVGVDRLTVGLGSVPEPTSMIALAAGAIGLVARKRRATSRRNTSTKEQFTS